MTGMLKVFSINLYALLDPGATLLFGTRLVEKKFDTLPDIVHEPLIESTPMGESLVAKKVYRNCPIMLSNGVSYVELVELNSLIFISFSVWIGYMLALPLSL